MFIDTHSHIYSKEFDSDREEVIKRTLEANVRYMVLPDIDQKSRHALFDLTQRHPQTMLPTLGIHPTSVDSLYKDEIKSMDKWLGKHDIVAIGECGIDLYWDKNYYKEQVIVFERQLHIAREMNLPVIIHSRDSLPEIFSILQRQHYNMKGIFHCFPGDKEDAQRAIDLGFLLGIGGIVTFKKSLMANVVQEIGLNNIVLETDSPYLAPSPHRGKRNESSYIIHIANKISEILECETKKIEEITTKNAMNLFYLHYQSIL